MAVPLRLRSQWRYLYRSLDHFGQVIDVYASNATAKRPAWFFQRALAAGAAPVYPRLPAL